MKLTAARNYDATTCNILLYGPSGSGKTYGSATGAEGSKIAILETEANGLISIRASNPDALVVEGKDIKTIQQFIIAASDGTFAKQGIEVLVFDSLTEIQQMIKEEIQGKASNMTQQQWGILLNRSRRLLRSIRDLPFHVICTALAKVEVTDQQERFTEPFLEGSIRREAAQYFNAVGYCYTEIQGNKEDLSVSYQVMFAGGAATICKACSPLLPIEDGPVSGWIDRCLNNFSPTLAIAENNSK